MWVSTSGNAVSPPARSTHASRCKFARQRLASRSSCGKARVAVAHPQLPAHDVQWFSWCLTHVRTFGALRRILRLKEEFGGDRGVVGYRCPPQRRDDCLRREEWSRPSPARPPLMTATAPAVFEWAQKTYAPENRRKSHPETARNFSGYALFAGSTRQTEPVARDRRSRCVEFLRR